MNPNNKKSFKDAKKKRNKRLEGFLTKSRFIEKSGNSSSFTQRPSQYRFNSYISSRCQIILMPGTSCDETLNSSFSVPFESVLLFIKPQFELEICPICLERPYPPAITKCGHIYCFKCILAYIVINESGIFCPCPVCNFVLTKNCIRLLLWSDVKEIKIGDQVSLYLCVKKCSESSFISTVDNTIPKNFSILNLNILSNEQLIISALPCINKVFNYPSDDTSVLNLLQYLQKWTNEEIISNGEYSCLPHFSQALTCSLNYFLSLYQILSKKASIVHITDEVEHSKTQNKEVYFYQMIDAYNMFLDLVNIKQLKKCFPYTSSKNSGWDKVPTLVIGIVVNISNHIVDKLEMHNYKFLSHLAPFSEFKFCILRLTEPDCPQPSIENIQNKSIKKENTIESDKDEKYITEDCDDSEQFSSTIEEELECLYFDEVEDNRSRGNKKNNKNNSFQK